MANPSRAKLRHLTIWLGWGLALTCLVASATVLIWYSRGGTLLAVQTGSMQPGIRPGDAVAIRRVSLNALRVGDIVSYRIAGTTTVITHRIMHLESSGVTLTTQGDNLRKADTPISSSQVLGRAVWLLPRLGRVVDVLHGWPGLVVGIYLPAIWLSLNEMTTLTRAYHHTAYRAFGYH